LHFYDLRLSNLLLSNLFRTLSRNLLSLRTLCAVLRAALFAILYPCGVEGATDNVVTHTGQVFDPTAANHDDGVLLQVVSDAGDVGGDFKPGGEPYPRDFAQGGVGFLGGGGVNAGANAPSLGASLEGGGFGFPLNGLAFGMD
jgi:hypothetical protein